MLWLERWSLLQVLLWFVTHFAIEQRGSFEEAVLAHRTSVKREWSPSDVDFGPVSMQSLVV